jgi:ABC-2 type transport system permease protein
MPPLPQKVMLLSPSTHFVSIAQAILYRGAGIDVVWPHYVIVALAGALLLWLAVLRFRQVTMQAT